MNELQIFNNPEFGKVRTIVIDGEPWFVGKDVAMALGYEKPRNAIGTHVDDEDKKGAPIQGPHGGGQQMIIINESGVYSLIFSSKLPKAKEFKRWVTSEVLPTIRKQGGYLTPKAAEKLGQVAASVQALADRVTALEDAAANPFAFAVPAPAPLPEGGVQKPHTPGRDYMKRWMRTASEKLELMSNKFNMGNNAILHKLYGYLEEDFGVVLADERLRIMEEYGLEECSTLKAIFYNDEFRDYLEEIIDHNLASENRGW